jgi:hypothetical protein
VSAFSSVDVFHRLDDRREKSQEWDYGVWWRWQDDVFRLTWVERTGELIAVRTRARQDRGELIGVAVHLDARQALADDRMDVVVLGTFRSRLEMEKVLEGWAYECDLADSLGWVLDRVEMHTLPSRRRRGLLRR